MLAGSLGDDVDDDDRQSMGFQMGNARLLNKPQNNYVWSWFFIAFRSKSKCVSILSSFCH